MSDTKDIYVIDILGTTLNSREANYEVFKSIDLSNVTKIHIDFSGVEFMSRSFADEFFKFRKLLENEKEIRFIMVNLNLEISKILQAVEKTNRKDRTVRKTNKFNHLKFTNQEALSKYLLAH
jgi:anti-anti-sigma regulatory factor